MPASRQYQIQSLIATSAAASAAALAVSSTLSAADFYSDAVGTALRGSEWIALSVIAAHALIEWVNRYKTGVTASQFGLSATILCLTVFCFGSVSFLGWLRLSGEIGSAAASFAFAAFMGGVVAVAAAHAAAMQQRERKTKTELSAARSSSGLVLGGIAAAIFLVTAFQTVAMYNNVGNWRDASAAATLDTLLHAQVKLVSVLEDREETGLSHSISRAAAMAALAHNQPAVGRAADTFRLAFAIYARPGIESFDSRTLQTAGDDLLRSLQSGFSDSFSGGQLNQVAAAANHYRAQARAAIDQIEDYFSTTIPAIRGAQADRLVAGSLMIFLYAFSLLLPVIRLIWAHEARLSRLSLALEQTRVPVILSDARHKVIWVNRAFEEVTGFTASEVVGTWTPALLQIGENDPQVAAKFGAALKARAPMRETIVNRRKDGAVYWVELDVQPVFSSDGTFEGYRSVATDVTSLVKAVQEQHQQARSLEESEQKFRNLAECSRDIIVLISKTGAVTYVSPSSRMIGYEPHELLGFEGYKLLHPDDAPSVRARTAEMLQTGSIAPETQRTMRYIAKDGRAIWFESSPSILRASDGSITGVTLQLRNIDERKRFTDQLAEREALLESIAVISGVGGWALDMNTMRPIWSEQARAIHEVADDFSPSIEDAIDFFAPEARPAIEDAIAEAIETGAPWDLELPFVTAKGRRLWVRTTGRPERRDGKMVRLVGAIEDITATREATEALVTARDDARRALEDAARFQIALAAERQRLSNVIDATQSGSWEMNLADGTVWVNERWAAILGYTRDELEPLTFDRLRSLIHPDDVKRFEEALAAHLRGDTELFEFEKRLLHKDGREVWALTRGRVMERDAAGKPILVSGTRQDITERKLAEQRVQLLTNRLGLAVEASNVGIWEFNMQTRVLTWDTRVRELFGASPSFVPTFEYWQTLIHEDDREKTLSHMYTAHEQGEIWRAEYRVIRPDGSVRHVRSGARFYRDANGVECIVGVIWDRTGDVRRNEELEKRRMEAEAAGMAKSQFLATMSHEIRTPMNGVLGMLELLMREELPPGQRERAGMAHESASSLLNILNDILDFSKLEANQLKIERIPTDFSGLVRDALNLFTTRAAEKSLGLELTLAADLPKRVNIDPTRVRQILINLIGNAIKFTESGSVSVRVAADLRGEDTLLVQVIDTGIGISEEARGRLFQRFMQADSSTTRKFGGTGLGLAICRQLAELLGGRIGVEPRDGGGSIFWFTIKAPVAATPEEPTLRSDIAKAPAVPDTYVRSLRVLVAEDNRINQKIIASFLAPARHLIDIVANGEEALEALARKTYDLVLMDIQMPVMDGPTATRRIRDSGKSWSDIPIIALTANAMAGDRENYLALGMNGYVSKPINISTLFAEIASVIRDPGADAAAHSARA